MLLLIAACGDGDEVPEGDGTGMMDAGRFDAGPLDGGASDASRDAR